MNFTAQVGNLTTRMGLIAMHPFACAQSAGCMPVVATRTVETPASL